jgi:hypothetical protein
MTSTAITCGRAFRLSVSRRSGEFPSRQLCCRTEAMFSLHTASSGHAPHTSTAEPSAWEAIRVSLCPGFEFTDKFASRPVGGILPRPRVFAALAQVRLARSKRLAVLSGGNSECSRFRSVGIQCEGRGCRLRHQNLPAIIQHAHQSAKRCVSVSDRAGVLSRSSTAVCYGRQKADNRRDSRQTPEPGFRRWRRCSG